MGPCSLFTEIERLSQLKFHNVILTGGSKNGLPVILTQ